MNWNLNLKRWVWTQACIVILLYVLSWELNIIPSRLFCRQSWTLKCIALLFWLLGNLCCVKKPSQSSDSFLHVSGQDTYSWITASKCYRTEPNGIRSQFRTALNDFHQSLGKLSAASPQRAASMHETYFTYFSSCPEVIIMVRSRKILCSNTDTLLYWQDGYTGGGCLAMIFKFALHHITPRPSNPQSSTSSLHKFAALYDLILCQIPWCPGFSCSRSWSHPPSYLPVND